MKSDNRGNFQRAGHNGRMGGLAANLCGKSHDELPIELCRVRRGEVVGDNDMLPIMRGHAPGGLAEQVANHPARHVLDVHHPLTQKGIVDLRKSPAVFLRHLMEDILDVRSLALEIAQHLVNQRPILDHEKVGIEDARIVGADGAGNSLLGGEQFRPCGDQGGLEARDLPREFLGLNLPEGDFLILLPLDHDGAMGNAGRHGNARESLLVSGGLWSLHDGGIPSKKNPPSKPLNYSSPKRLSTRFLISATALSASIPSAITWRRDPFPAASIMSPMMLFPFTRSPSFSTQTSDR